MRSPRLVMGLLLIGLVADLHVVVFQAVGWTRMFVEFQAESGVAEAMVRTFSGAEPCCLCEVVEQMTGDEADEKPSSNSRLPVESPLKILSVTERILYPHTPAIFSLGLDPQLPGSLDWQSPWRPPS